MPRNGIIGRLDMSKANFVFDGRETSEVFEISRCEGRMRRDVALRCELMRNDLPVFRCSCATRYRQQRSQRGFNTISEAISRAIGQVRSNKISKRKESGQRIDIAMMIEFALNVSQQNYSTIVHVHIPLSNKHQRHRINAVRSPRPQSLIKDHLSTSRAICTTTCPGQNARLVEYPKGISPFPIHCKRKKVPFPCLSRNCLDAVAEIFAWLTERKS